MRNTQPIKHIYKDFYNKLARETRDFFIEKPTKLIDSTLYVILYYMLKFTLQFSQ